MSTTEIKEFVDRLTADEFMELQACLWEKAGVPCVKVGAHLDGRMKAMDEGRFVRWEDIRDEVLRRENEAEP